MSGTVATPTIGTALGLPSQFGGLLDFYVDKKIDKIKNKASKKSGGTSYSAPAPAMSAEAPAPSSIAKYLPYALGAAVLVVLVVVMRK